MRIDRDVRVVIEIFPVSVTIVWLQQAQQSAFAQLRFKLTQHPGQVGLGNMFEEIARKGKVYGFILQERQVSCASHVALDPRLEKRRHLRPDVQGNATAGFDVVDEVAVPSSQFEYAILGSNPALEVVFKQRTP